MDIKSTLTTLGSQNAIELICLDHTYFSTWLTQNPEYKQWVELHEFKADSEQVLLLPNMKQALIGVEGEAFIWWLASAVNKLPKNKDYILNQSALESLNNNFKNSDSKEHIEQLALGWALAGYQFDKYQKTKPVSKLVVSVDVFESVSQYGRAIYFIRDLINTPAEDLNPESLDLFAKNLSVEFNAKYQSIIGDDLLKNNYPSIHAVGRAGMFEPRLIHLEWGDKNHPSLNLVGKGVCFDSGGLDIKSAAGMRQMKKDMGGSAHVLGLAYLIMAYKLPIYLNLYIPAVENNVSANSFRPGDVIQSRKNISIEVGNTDAEGRLILCDALAKSCEDNPDLLIDFATLTGAARVALGTDLPALFTNTDNLAQKIKLLGDKLSDPIWHMPLYQPYKKQLKSKIADIHNISNSGYGGSITAALFLERFVDKNIPWVHFDLMAANADNSKPGRPEGGEAQGLRAVFEYLKQWCLLG